MKIEIISCLSDNYSYLIHDEESNTVAIIDPSEFKPCDKIIKKYNKLDFILNTHHHADHVNGNLELKKKYNSKILGFSQDKRRIPGIDILLEENQKQKIGNLEFEVMFIPGHTKGHIAFFFSKEKIAFTGDTLFSLGCGRVFEGTHEEMFYSLNKIKNLPPDTKIYCGHEYTKSNLDFCLTYDTQNTSLKEKAIDIQKKLNSNLPTIPTILGQEVKTNIFLRCNDPEIKLALDLKDSSEVEVFSKLRDLKDSF
ncbi:hydroxyacylglutathione hydrolase [Candidatus Pelagibacter bacterium]|nr:hydroxyacylglutathione hydrolase [Candidatus Pelagibacter bacterium]